MIFEDLVIEQVRGNLRIVTALDAIPTVRALPCASPAFGRGFMIHTAVLDHQLLCVVAAI
jgi:hypothetical protein